VRPCKLPSPHGFLQTLKGRPEAEAEVQRARVANVPRWAFLVVVEAQAGGDEEDGDGDDDEEDGRRGRQLGRASAARLINTQSDILQRVRSNT
jgi:hypothetical protein